MVMQHVWSKGVSSFKFRAKPDFNICSRRRLFCGLGVAETGNLKLQTSSLAFRNQNGQLDARFFLNSILKFSYSVPQFGWPLI